MKQALYIVLLLIVASCAGSKKEFSSEKEMQIDSTKQSTAQTDTVYKDRIVYKTRPASGALTVEQPCDSTGFLRPFVFDFGSGENSGKVESKEGKLHLDFKLDSIIDSFKKEYRSKHVADSLLINARLLKELESQKEEVRVVWPWWLYAALIIGGLSLAANILQRLRII